MKTGQSKLIKSGQNSPLLTKAKKRIAKQVKKGFHGYPLVSLEYFGKAPDSATD